MKDIPRDRRIRAKSVSVAFTFLVPIWFHVTAMVTAEVICTPCQTEDGPELSPPAWWLPVTNSVTFDTMARPRSKPTKPTITLRIRAERELRNWSLEDLAGRLGVARQTVGRWETSGRDVGVENLNAIAKVMNIPVRQLLPGDDGLAADERALLEMYRAAPAHERRAILGMATTLHEGRSVGFSPRAASGK